MIHSDEELATALEAVSRWLEHPPEHGSAEEQRFHILLREIEDYHPTIEMPAEDEAETAERALRKLFALACRAQAGGAA